MFIAYCKTYRLIVMSVDATKSALTFAVTDGMVYGNVSFKMTCILLVPIWHLFWSQVSPVRQVVCMFITLMKEFF